MENLTKRRPRIGHGTQYTAVCTTSTGKIPSQTFSYDGYKYDSPFDQGENITAVMCKHMGCERLSFHVDEFHAQVLRKFACRMVQ